MMDLNLGRKHGLIVMLGMLVFTPPLTMGGSQDLKNVYRSGPIILKNAPGFGEGTDWKTQFYNTFTDIIVAADGSIFAASSRQHTIFKFDSKGSLIKSFGQKGQGPGDFNGPDDLSILDGKYLVVGEYALGHRISLFDLDGNFVKLLKTKHHVYSSTALRDGKVAYIGITHREQDSLHPVEIQTVYIKDIDTQEETEVHSYRTTARSIRLKWGGSIGFSGDTGGQTYLVRTHEGNLAVGISMEPHVTVYSLDGSKLSEFSLRGKPVPVTKSIIRRYKDIQLNNMRQDPQHQQGIWKESLKELKKASFDHLFSDYLPLYHEILTDEEGHLLVFRSEDCFVDCPILIDVYSSEGEFVCETEIKTGNYHLIVDKRRKHMCFTKSGLVALVQPKEEVYDFHLKMIKVVFDYPHQRMFLSPYEANVKPFEFNMLGISYEQRMDKSLYVRDVIIDSPASEKGIKMGDIIIAINGKNLQDYDYMDIYDLFREENNKIEITLQRELKLTKVALTLKRLI
jgi:hypothetical protein